MNFFTRKEWSCVGNGQSMLADSHCSVKLVIVSCGIIQSKPKLSIQIVDQFSSSCFLYFEILVKFADILLFSFIHNGLILSIVCVDEKITAQLYKYLSILVLLVKLCNLFKR